MAKKKSNIKQFHTSSKKSTSRPKKNSYEAKKAEIEERRKIASLEKKESARVEREKKRDEKKTQRAEKRKLDSEKVAAELIGLLFIALGLYMLICLFNISTGSLGVIIRDCMHGLLGYFAFFIPLAAIGGGVLCLLPVGRKITASKVVLTVVLLLIFSMFLQTFPYAHGRFETDSLMGFLRDAYNKGLNLVGTGLLSSIPLYTMESLFGMAGTRILLIFAFICFSIWLFQVSITAYVERSIAALRQKHDQKKQGRSMPQENVEIEAKIIKMPTAQQTASARPQYSNAPEVSSGRRPKSTTPYFEPSLVKNPSPVEVDEIAQQYDSEDQYDDVPFEENTPNPQENLVSRPVKPRKQSSPAKAATQLEIGELPAEFSDDIADKIDAVAAPAYIFPSPDLLEPPQHTDDDEVDEKELRTKAKIIEKTLADFGIAGGKVNHITCGPVITRYEYSVPPGIKMSKITSLDKELAYSLACSSIRIEAPIPNKAAVGFEVPNRKRSTVYIRELLESEEFRSKDSLLAFVVGKDIAGNIIIGDIAKMPHTLICGATGSGKSVFMNGILLSILFKAAPNEVKLIMIDPKKVEFEKYKGIPHLLFPVVSNPKRAAGVLAWCVKEMEERYEKMAQHGVRDLRRYNQLMMKHPSADPDLQPLPLIVIVIDELSDLMVVAGDEVEESIYRLAQMARAAGMYLLIATQRPSVDVVTGVIKANIPSRIALKTASSHDSRTILDTVGAEQLLGNGDMIYKPQGLDRPLRVQGAWVSDEEVENVVEFIKSQHIPTPEPATEESMENKLSKIEKNFEEAGRVDDLLFDAIQYVVDRQEASVSTLQRRFRIGHSRAGALIDEMEQRGIVGPHLGSKPREVLVTKEEYENGYRLNDED